MRQCWLVAPSAFALLTVTMCTSWQDETKGTASPAQTTATGGSGGGDACLSCSAFFRASSTCQAPDCPSVDQVCGGAAREALDAFLDCAFCDACPADCPGMCGATDAGLGDVSGPCQGCLIGALGGVCASQYASCTEN